MVVWGSGQLGIFGVAYSLGFTPMYLLGMVIGEIIGPIVYSQSPTERGKSRVGGAARPAQNRIVWCGVGGILFVTITGIVVSMVFGDVFCRFFVSERFYSIAQYLPQLIGVGGLVAAGEILSIGLLVSEPSKSVMGVKAVMALCGTLAVSVGAATAGVNGLILAMVATNVVQVIVLSGWLGGKECVRERPKLIGLTPEGCDSEHALVVTR